MPKFLLKILMPLMSKLTPACNVISQKISESMDHSLSFTDRLKVRIHLLGCALCTRYEKQLLAMHQILQSQSDEIKEADTGISLSDDARLRIQQAIDKNKTT